ncbi:hypothetical protein J2782_003161 [Brucella pseudogrignonensis]|uniref:Uncharacterized protein n=1 Tax=Brucella pseudogrignonensis TaxID=419475 RepID=A0ABU1MC83_9HYPH|nr:hypothetical protein [Brucella pseudogrignonensis]
MRHVSVHAFIRTPLYQFSLAINGVVFVRFTSCFGAVATLMICCCGFKRSFLNLILAHALLYMPISSVL